MAMPEETRKKLLKLIDQVADIERKRLDIRRERESIFERTRVIRAQLVLDIASARDDRGRPRYPNEQTREAALTLKLAEHEEWRRLSDRLRKLYEEDDLLAIEHNRLADRKAVSMMEMGLAASPDGPLEGGR